MTSEPTTGYAKITISGSLAVLTGLHIGTSAGFAAIGATDKPVVRDPLTKLPVIPGTSLKGKMRSLLSRQLGSDAGVAAKTPAADDARIRRLFGDTSEFMTGRLIFRDTVLANGQKLERRGAKTLTEVKFENSIDRISAVANPRQIERVIPGSQFRFSLVYEIAISPRTGELPNPYEIKEDFATVVTGLRLLELDYLGGHGTRGYGRVKFQELRAEVPVGEVAPGLLKDLNDALAAF